MAGRPTYGDQLFILIRQRIPKNLLTLDGLSDAALQSLVSFGPPILLSTLGSWLIYRGWRHASGRAAMEAAYEAKMAELKGNNPTN